MPESPARGDSPGPAGPGSVRPSRCPEELRATGRRARTGSGADSRRHHLFGLRLAQRAAHSPPARRDGGGHQLCDPARARALGRAPDQAVADPRGDRRHRLSGPPVRCGALGVAGAEGTARRAVALVRRRLRHDAGDDVRDTGVPGGRGHHDAGHRAVDALGQPGADPAGDLLLGGAVLSQRLARSAVPARRHGRAGGAGRRRRLPGQHLGDADRVGRGLFRFGHHVRVLPAWWPLPGNGGAPESGARRRGAGARPAGLCRALCRLSGR